MRQLNLSPSRVMHRIEVQQSKAGGNKTNSGGMVLANTSTSLMVQLGDTQLGISPISPLIGSVRWCG
ncbi:hypothetical protein E2C01_030100 [Portunus trituberculatus]|uniref:Uncharacterized protein n=1 Tax=Portunus trituberculatus TaxID=210409 RepID=A0A5B7ETB8_PORTR|nr:hypothetical protein [Portunus trituberculatus]